jgi:thiol-disulfide isomerase/thioredoxin
MRFRILTRSCLVVLALSAIAAAQSGPTLKVGMAAPPLKVAKWFKGTPVEKLETGKIYVVEFWATWCGPCRTSIPHVSELAKKYGDKVTVIGVSVAERPKEPTNEAIAALVEPFVKEMGDQMSYNVAADDAGGTMDKTWMTAAGQTGIPCAFIVSKETKIAWIGHPMQMDKPLEAIVAGTYNVEAQSAAQAKKDKEQQELTDMVEQIKAAVATKDPNAIMKAANKAVEAKPDLLPPTVNALLQIDEGSAFSYVKMWADKGFFDKNPAMAYVTATVVDQRGDSLKKPDWPLLLGVMQKANDSRQSKDWAILACYASMLARTGQIDKAIELQQKAIDLASQFAGTLASQTWIDTQKERMEDYKARKK